MKHGYHNGRGTVFVFAMMVLLTVIAAQPARGQQVASKDSGVSPASFDLNRDGLLDLTEATAYFRARRARLMSLDADKDQDGRISQEEFSAYNKAFDAELQGLVDDDIAQYKAQLQAGYPMTVREISEHYPPIDPPKVPVKPSSTTFLLRSKVEDLDVSFDKAEPSNFTYSHGFDPGVDSWSLKGVAAVRITGGERSPWSLIGSAAFDRVTNSEDPTKETNSLIPRIQGDWTLEGDADVVQLHQIRASAAYATDFDASSKVPAAELEYEPTLLHLAVGVSHPLLNVIDYRFRVFVHGEYGRVVDAGGKADLVATENSDFLRIGPVFQVEIWPSSPSLSRLSLTIEFRHLNDFLNDYDGTDLLTVSLKQQLDEAGNFFLTLDYRNGQTPLVQDDVNQFSIGVGVKF